MLDNTENRMSINKAAVWVMTSRYYTEYLFAQAGTSLHPNVPGVVDVGDDENFTKKGLKMDG